MLYRASNTVQLLVTFSLHLHQHCEVCESKKKKITSAVLFLSVKLYYCSLIVMSPLNLASTTLSHNFVL